MHALHRLLAGSLRPKNPRKSWQHPQQSNTEPESKRIMEMALAEKMVGLRAFSARSRSRKFWRGKPRIFFPWWHENSRPGSCRHRLPIDRVLFKLKRKIRGNARGHGVIKISKSRILSFAHPWYFIFGYRMFQSIFLLFVLGSKSQWFLETSKGPRIVRGDRPSEGFPTRLLLLDWRIWNKRLGRAQSESKSDRVAVFILPCIHESDKRARYESYLPLSSPVSSSLKQSSWDSTPRPKSQWLFRSIAQALELNEEVFP